MMTYGYSTIINMWLHFEAKGTKLMLLLNMVPIEQSAMILSTKVKNVPEPYHKQRLKQTCDL